MPSDEPTSKLSNSFHRRVVNFSDKGVDQVTSKPVQRWEIEWSPKFTAAQWAEFKMRQQEAWNPEMKTFDKERAKNLIRSIAPDSVFIGSL